MFIKNFKKYWEYKNSSEKRFHKKDGKKHEKKDPPICYKCKEVGHVKSECPLLNKEGKFKRAMKTTWDELDSDNSSDEAFDN